MEKNLVYTELLDIYKGLLTEKQAEAMEYYYDQDYSLSEISEIMDISRQGVRDSIKKAERELFFFEEHLGLVARDAAVREAGERLLTLPLEGDARQAAEKLLAAALGENA